MNMIEIPDDRIFTDSPAVMAFLGDSSFGAYSIFHPSYAALREAHILKGVDGVELQPDSSVLPREIALPNGVVLFRTRLIVVDETLWIKSQRFSFTTLGQVITVNGKVCIDTGVPQSEGGAGLIDWLQTLV